MEPFFSLLLPCFNAAAHIERALQSIAEQSEKDFELLIIDGGSTDETPHIVARYIDHVRWFRSESDGGIYDALNKGLAEARGEYIYILGADDQLASPNVLREARQGIEQAQKPDIAYGAVAQTDARNARVLPWHQSVFNHQLYWRNCLHTQSCFYKRSVITQLGFDTHYRVLADYHLHLRLFKRKVSHAAILVHVANCSAQGLSKQFKSELYLEEWRIKRRELSLLMAIFQWPWVWMKYFYKKTG